MYSRWALRESQPHIVEIRLNWTTHSHNEPRMSFVFSKYLCTPFLCCAAIFVYIFRIFHQPDDPENALTACTRRNYTRFSRHYERENYMRGGCVEFFFAPPSFRCCNFLCRQYVWRNIKSLWASSAASHRTGDRSIIAKSRCRSGNEIARNAARS